MGLFALITELKSSQSQKKRLRFFVLSYPSEDTRREGKVEAYSSWYSLPDCGSFDLLESDLYSFCYEKLKEIDRFKDSEDILIDAVVEETEAASEEPTEEPVVNPIEDETFVP